MNLQRAAETYHEQVDDDALEFFADAGISKAMVEEFRLGWVHDPVMSQHRGVLNMPVFPYITVPGKVVQLRFDAFRQDMMGRHTDIVIGRDFPFTIPDHHLYNVRHALPGLRTSQVVLTSDVRSCIIGRQTGWRTVAVPGYRNFHSPWVHLFEDAHVVFVWSVEEDGPAEKVQQLFVRAGIDILPVRLPAGETLASTIGPDLPRGTDIVDLLGSMTVRQERT